MQTNSDEEELIMGFWEKLDDVIDDFGDFVVDGIDATGELVGGVIDATGELVEGLGEVASDTFEEIKEDPVEYITDSAKDIVEVAPALICPIVPAWRMTKEFCSTVFMKNVKPIPGSLLYRDLGAGWADHTGIYVGNDQIVELISNGRVRVVSPTTFLGDGTGTCIYVSCRDECVVGSEIVAKRALSQVDGTRDYNLFLDNCHQFSSGCITGDFENADNLLWMVKHTCGEYMGANKWRIWER